MNKVIIQYKKKFVGGYSLKTNKVWFVPQKEQANIFTSVKAGEFIAKHVNSGRGFESENITLLLVKKSNR